MLNLLLNISSSINIWLIFVIGNLFSKTLVQKLGKSKNDEWIVKTKKDKKTGLYFSYEKAVQV